MANLSNINNILRTGSLGVGINRDPLGAFEISSATKPGIKMFNTAASGKTYEAYSDINGNYIIFDQDANDNRFVINSAGNATFSGSVTSSYLAVNGSAIVAEFNGAGSSYVQGAIALRSSNADTPEARGQGVFMYNQGTDTTWYTGTRYSNADVFQIGHATGTSLNSESARSQNAFLTVLNDGKVGIGTVSPSNKLDVFAANNFEGIALTDSAETLWNILKSGSSVNTSYFNMFSQELGK